MDEDAPDDDFALSRAPDRLSFADAERSLLGGLIDPGPPERCSSDPRTAKTSIVDETEPSLEGQAANTFTPRASAREPASSPCAVIAVLDDDPDAVESICACLQRYSVRAVPFTTAADLLAALDKHTINAFVLDWSLGDGTSEALVHALRQHPAARSKPIFILTGGLLNTGLLIDRQLARAITQYGLEYRSKPVSCARLARDVAAALESCLSRSTADLAL